MKLGGAASIVLNAANEIGVEAFIQGKIGFTDIARLCHAMMYGFQPPAPTNLEAILDTDKQARKLAQSWIEGFATNWRTNLDIVDDHCCLCGNDRYFDYLS